MNDLTEKDLINTYKKIKQELSSYDKKLVNKKEIIFFNKSDLVDSNDIKSKLNEFNKKINTNYEIVSVYSKADVTKIKKILIKYASQ